MLEQRSSIFSVGGKIRGGECTTDLYFLSLVFCLFSVQITPAIFLIGPRFPAVELIATHEHCFVSARGKVNSLNISFPRWRCCTTGKYVDTRIVFSATARRKNVGLRRINLRDNFWCPIAGHLKEAELKVCGGCWPLEERLLESTFLPERREVWQFPEANLQVGQH
ncbi:hypothetical protein ANTQUA_LOCUS3811 [Anthophora quadrimaculata]